MSSTVLCMHGGYCVRKEGHSGAHTACPSAATLDWDKYRSSLEGNAEMLRGLDFETPPWADLLDNQEDEAA